MKDKLEQLRFEDLQQKQKELLVLVYKLEKQKILRGIVESGRFEIRFEEAKPLLKPATGYNWSATRVRKTKEN